MAIRNTGQLHTQGQIKPRSSGPVPHYIVSGELVLQTDTSNMWQKTSFRIARECSIGISEGSLLGIGSLPASRLAGRRHDVCVVCSHELALLHLRRLLLQYPVQMSILCMSREKFNTCAETGSPQARIHTKSWIS